MALSLAEAQALAEPILAREDAYRLSHRGRDRAGLTGRSFVYGETLPGPLFALLSGLPLQPSAAFYDLGSGAGRAVLYAALLWDLRLAVGVELLPELVEAARRSEQRLAAALAARPEAPRLSPVRWVEGSLADQELGGADVVYAVAELFEPALLEALVAKLPSLRPGTWVVTVGQPLASDRLTPARLRVPYATGWGDSEAFVYRVRPVADRP